MKKLITTIFIACLSLTPSLAKEYSFHINSQGFELTSARLVLNCVDRSPVQEVLSMGLGTLQFMRKGR